MRACYPLPSLSILSPMHRGIYIAMVVTLVAVTTTPAQTGSQPAGLQFHAAHRALKLADQAREQDNVKQAIKLYQEAMSEYARLSTAFPDWQPGVTRFRTAYCRDQLDALLSRFTGTPAPTTPGTSGTRATPPPANQATAGVTRLLQEGRTDLATERLLAALRRNPDDRRVRLLLAAARCQEGKYGDAMYVLKQLVRERRDEVANHMALAAAYTGLGRLDDAIRSLNIVLSLDTHLAAAHYNMAQLHLATQPPSRDGALHHYRRCLEEGGKPDPELNRHLGMPPPARDTRESTEPADDAAGGFRPFRWLGLGRDEEAGSAETE